MTLLAPWLLLAAGAAAVPILLHFLQRSRGRTVSFPAVRYLQRTAKDHARSIRARQKLLLVLRVLLLTLLALAAARPLLTAVSTEHPPTAVALVIDNTASSGAVDGGVRVLDRLKRVGRASLDEAGEGDRFWVVRVGEPWIPARPLNAASARRALDEVTPAPNGASLAPSVLRAMDLVRAAGLDGAEIHVLSDLQRSALAGLRNGEPPGDRSRGPDPSVLVWRDTLPPPPNVGVSGILVDGGLPPMPGDRAGFVFSLTGSGATSEVIPVRLFAGDRLRGRVDGEVGTPGVIEAGPFPSGWVTGSVEVDPDALRADDRRFFAFRVRPPVTVEGLGEAGPFVDEGLRVLEESGRVRLVRSGGDVLVLGGGGGGRAQTGQRSILVFPSTDETLIPGLNRFLAELGIGWSFGPPLDPGTVPLRSRGIPGLDGVEVTGGYRLLAATTGGGGVLASTGTGEPWLVEATRAGVRVLIVASPLHPGFTTLPVRAGMIPFLDWAVTRWAAGSSVADEVMAGEDLAPPPGATAVLTPDGVRLPTEGGGAVQRVGPGFYRFLAGDSVLSAVAVNVPPGESDLTRSGPAPLSALAGDDGAVVSSMEEWHRVIFRARTGPEGGLLLLALALVLLLVEALVAASGRAGDGERVRPPSPAGIDGGPRP